MPKSRRVREPVQVYLDERDRALLDDAAARTSLPRTEVLRVALRRLAADLPGSRAPGTALPALVGSLDAADDVPRDLAARHDDYLYATPARAVRSARERKAKRERK
jgi:hypothetical protein